MRAPIPGVTILSRDGLQVKASVDGVTVQVAVHATGREVWLAWQGHIFHFEEPSAAPADATRADASQVRSPVAGTVGQVMVQPGDRVSPGQALVSVEAMKMQIWQHATTAGTVQAVAAAAGAPVAAGALLVQLEIDP